MLRKLFRTITLKYLGILFLNKEEFLSTYLTLLIKAMCRQFRKYYSFINIGTLNK